MTSPTIVLLWSQLIKYFANGKGYINDTSFYYIDTDEISECFLSLKNHIFIARSEDIIFYLSLARILVSPWLLKWIANYKRASRSGAGRVLLKFHSQNGFEARRRYSYRWLSRWAAKFSHRYFFRAWRTFRKICRSLGKWCWKIHWGGRKCKQ